MPPIPVPLALWSPPFSSCQLSEVTWLYVPVTFLSLLRKPRVGSSPFCANPMLMKCFFRLRLRSWFKAPLLVLSSSHQHSFHTRMALRNWGVQNLHKQMIQNTLVGAWGHPEQSGREWLPWETGAWCITRYPDPRKTPTGSWLKSWV